MTKSNYVSHNTHWEGLVSFWILLLFRFVLSSQFANKFPENYNFVIYLNYPHR